jgi:hypothetical protein
MSEAMRDRGPDEHDRPGRIPAELVADPDPAAPETT